MKKVALITGASSGIGLDTSLRLLDEGYIVYGAARRTELMKPIQEKSGNIVSLDLYDDNSIKNCIESIIEKEGRIDVLVNNAGFGLGGSIENLPMEEVKKQFEINVFSLARVIQLVLPCMKRQKSGKIINISSMAGRFSSPFTGWYHASKYSVEALSDALRHEVAPFGIKVVIIEPGTIKTNWGVIHAQNIRKYSGTENDGYTQNADSVASWYEKRYVGHKFVSEPDVISKTIVKAVLSKNPGIRYAVGSSAKINIFMKKFFSDKAFDLITRICLNLRK